MKFINRHLTTKISAYFLLLSITTTAIVGTISFARGREALEEGTFKRLSIAATLKEGEIDRWFEDRQRDFFLTTQLPEVKADLEKLLTDSAEDAEYQTAYANLVQYLQDIAEVSPNFKEIFVLDGGNRAIVSTDATNQGQYVVAGNLTYFDFEKTGVDGSFSPIFYISPVTGEPAITFASPVRNERGERIGAILAHLNLERIDRIVRERTGLGESGETYLVGSLVTGTDFISKSQTQTRDFPDGVTSPGIEEAMSGTSGFGLYPNYAGVPVIGVYRWLSDRDIALIVEMEQEEAFIFARHLAVQAILAGLLSAAGLSFIASLLSRQIARPILALADAAEGVASGDLQQSAPVLSQDEVGLLARNFNQMTQQLQESFSTLATQNAEMKTLNAALSESEQQLSQFLDAIPVGVFITDATGQPYYTNPAGERILGQGIIEPGNAEQLRHAYRVYLGGTDRLYPPECDPILRALQGESARVDDMEIHRPDAIVPIESSGTPIYDRQGNLAYAIVAFQDITKRKTAERVLADYNQTLARQVEERTQALQQEITERRHAQAQVQQKNQELGNTLEQLQTTQEELIQSEKMAALGQLVAGVAHEVNTPLGAIRSSVEHIADFLSERLEVLPEFFYELSPTNREVFVRLLHQALQPSTMLSSKEKRKIKRALKRQLESWDIEDADILADTLVDIEVYDEVEFLLPVVRDRARDRFFEMAYELVSLHKSTNTITLATDRAAKVVFALKSYARYDNSGQKRTAQIPDSIETVLTLYHNQLKHGVEVVRNYEDELTPIQCYPDELNQVWTNLVHNALQAMENRGTLAIDVCRQDDRLQVRITDNGTGIPPEIQAKIFTPFFTTKPPGEGSGLGLDIVKKIVAKHEGTIGVESVPGKTTFTVSLPLEG
ncbi:MAG: ATP-binding protein [Cyanobacteriota bacterium]|nr:ATP-binding protein [Cyanobacteriota bacterium]